MHPDRRFLRDKFTRIEIGFFLVYFILFNILTDIEYNLYERHNYVLFVKDIPGRLIYGIVYLIPFAICYKFLIRGYLFEKKYGRFFLLLALFLLLLNFYLLYSYWVISKLSFLPATITRDADTYYHSGALVHFSVIYILRELMVISFLAYFIRSAKQEKWMNAIREEQLQAELKYLKVQLQPHFFFNTLNNIYALTLEQSAEAAPLVAKHADMMRYILYHSTSPKTPLEEELAFLENYARVEAVRFGKKISVSFDKQGIQDRDTIEPLLLLPFVENAFKHGAGKETRTGYIRIIVCVVGRELILEVMNSKPALFENIAPVEKTGFADKTASPDKTGFPQNSRFPENSGFPDKKQGIGLKNARQRLSLLYPQRHLLEINEKDTDFELRLTLQLDTDG
ncbi:MAG: sensor histidine kinase [Puia sp.]|nr:sensor histidine kinase [Puia sp.]